MSNFLLYQTRCAHYHNALTHKEVDPGAIERQATLYESNTSELTKAYKDVKQGFTAHLIGAPLSVVDMNPGEVMTLCEQAIADGKAKRIKV